MNIPEVMDDACRSLLAREEIKDVLQSYCRGVDRRDFNLMRAAYHDDAYDDHGPYKGGPDGLIDWVRARHDQVQQSMHFLGRSLIDLRGDAAVSETYCVVHQRLTMPESGEARRIAVGCRYVDRLERRGGVWRIARRVVVHDWWQTFSADLDLELGPPYTTGERSSADPIYGMLEG